MTSEFFMLIGVGFFAQLVDGALGMAFGLISTTAMLSLGVPPAQASAAVHIARYVQPRALMIIVGILVCCLAIVQIVQSMHLL